GSSGPTTAAVAPPEPAAEPLVAVADEALHVSERSQCTWLVGSWQQFLGTFPRPFQIRDPSDTRAGKRDPAGYEGSIAQRYGVLADHAAGLRISDKRLKDLQQRGVSLAREVARDMDGADAKHLTAIADKEKAFIDDLNRYCIRFDVGSAEAAAKVI